MAQMRSAFALDAIMASVKRFRSDERGAMAFFMLFLLLIMLMIGGIAVDVMRFETRRVAMQQTMDRAVLAAANLTQKRTPTAIATDWFAKASLGTGLDMVSFGTPVISEVTDVGLRRVVGGFEGLALSEHVGHLGRVVLVHLTTEGLDVQLAGHVPDPGSRSATSASAGVSSQISIICPSGSSR